MRPSTRRVRDGWPMVLVRAAAAACATLVLVATALAQPGGAESPPAAEKLVQATAAPVTAAAGGVTSAVVKLAILPGWHVNANPPALEYNIPTSVRIAGAEGVAAARPRYPKGAQRKFGFEDQPLLVYDGAVEVSVPLRVDAGAAQGEHTLRGTVEFQACNDQLCLAPASVPFTVVVTVTAGAPGDGGTSPAPDTMTTTIQPLPTTRDGFVGLSGAGAQSAGAAAKNELEATLARGGFFWFLALFAGGLLLNLTPCVFPMLGVTVSIFGARRREPIPKVVTTAAVYVLGICVTYTLLGVVAALTGGLFGAALRTVWVSIVMGGLMLVLSLGMFGVYELQPPTWIMNRLGGAQATNLAGALFSGLGVGVIAAPCVGPFVIGVLALIAQKGDVGFGLATMFTLSLGLGFPYLFLATFANLIEALPRSGDWMVWVKHAFGTLMVGFGVYYLSIGLAPTWTPWVLPAALVLGGLWLGFVDRSAGARGDFKLFAMAVGSVAVIFGAVFGGMMFRAAARTLSFKPYDAAAVAASVAAGRPVMVDFSADWCVPCHELELNTLSDPRVVAEARRFDRYKMDLTRIDNPDSEASRKLYGVAGVPTIVFLGPGGHEIGAARVEGFVPPEAFLERMKVGGAR